MNWNEASDLEINKRIAEIEGFAVTTVMGDSVYCMKDVVYGIYRNFCNVPNDAWPLILKHKVDIDHNVGSCSVDLYLYLEKESLITYQVAHKNILREAMILICRANEVKE